MIKDIYDILIKHHCYSITIAPLKDNLNDVIEDIQRQLISNKYISLSEARSIMVDLWQYQRKIELKMFIDTPQIQSFLKDLLLDSSYVFDGQYIHCKKSFVCNIIKDDSCVYVLNDDQIHKMKKMNYEITGYSIEVNPIIYEIKCIGQHPNLKLDGCFCMDACLQDMPFCGSAIDYINEMLCQANISNSILNELDRYDILKIIQK